MMRNKKNWMTGLLAVSAMGLMTGCEQIQKLNNMASATSDMQGNLSRLANDVTPQLHTSACELYDALREGDTLASRREALKNLLAARNEARKISEAGKYYMAYEFQFWSRDCQDTDEIKHEILLASAAREFMREIQEFFPDGDLSPDPAAMQKGSNAFSSKNLKASLNALAAALHMLNPKQEYRGRTLGDFKTISMLDLVEGALDAKASIEKGEKSVSDFPEYVKEILLHEKYAVALLQARYNMAAAVAVDGISDISEGFFEKAKMFLFSWETKMSRANLAQLKEYQLYVQGALDTRDFLASHGYKPEMNKQFHHVLTNMRYVPDTSQSAEILNEQRKLYDLLVRFHDGN